MAEEVAQDLTDAALGGAELVLDVRAQGGLVHEAWNLRDRVADREEDAVNLRVLVCEQIDGREWENKAAGNS